jgi:intracellular septation protein
MMQLLELMPLVAFFTAYQFSGTTLQWGGMEYQLEGIYGATAVLMLATLIQVIIVRLWKGKVEKRLWYLVGAVLVFGSATLLLHDQRFIQWKPTIFNWAMASVLIISHLVGKNLIKRLLGEQLQLPLSVCARLTWVWGGYFFLVGSLNLIVVYTFSEAFWVSYKLWSAIGFTLIISVVTAFMLMPYLKMEEHSGDSSH